MASAGFHFEDLESGNLELDAEQAKEALEGICPIGSEVGKVVEYMSPLGTRCDKYPKYPETIYCNYGHVIWITARFPPFPVLKEWIAAVTYDVQTERVVKYEVTVGLTGS